MLTEKDYCDKDLSLALKEAGYIGQGRCYYDLDKEPHKLRHFGIQVLTTRSAEALNFILAVHLYDAQKWLREKHEIQVSVLPFEDCDTDADGNIVGRWVSYGFALQYTTTAMWIVNKGHTYDFDTINAQDTFEEALLEGIKEAVKILKKDETIHE